MLAHKEDIQHSTHSPSRPLPSKGEGGQRRCFMTLVMTCGTEQ